MHEANNQPNASDEPTFDAASFDEGAGTFEGRPFPSESEWLGLQLSHDEEESLLSDDFVDRTLLALRDVGPDALATYQPPPPSADFVANTVKVLQADRRERWRELLARYVAPEPSREFVSRTLRALEADSGQPAIVAGPRRPSLLRTMALPLAAAAAVTAVAFFLPNDDVPALELRVNETVPVAFGPAYATSPLPALLVTLDREADPYALPNSGGDGVWLLMHRTKR